MKTMIHDYRTIINKYAELRFRNQEKRDNFVKSIAARLNKDFNEAEKNKFIEALRDEIRKN